jgi:zinc/manganese transport system substrate-binding protein
MRTLPILVRVAGAVALAAALVACGDDDAATTTAASPEQETTAAAGTVVVTTNILGDVVENLVGDRAEVEVEVIMPPGADPHDFAPSARQAASMREADLLVVNGLGFEESLLSAIEGAQEDGVVVFEATSAVATIEFDDGHDDDDGHGHDDDDGHGHDDDGHGHDDDDGPGHTHEGEDPHVFTDPARMVDVVEELAEALAANLEGLDDGDFRDRVDGYLQDLRDLDAEIEAMVAELPEDRRVLVTNHDAFGYFADRYGFEVLGVVIPGGSTLAEPSAADIAELARQVEAEDVPAVFAETSAPARLAEALAAEVGAVEVVELFSESLGDAGSGGETYLDMMRTNAQRIVEALG